MKTKRILAILTVVFLISLYILTLIFAIMKSPYSFQLFIACAVCSIIIPLLMHMLLVLINIKNGGKVFDEPYSYKKGE